VNDGTRAQGSAHALSLETLCAAGATAAALLLLQHTDTRRLGQHAHGQLRRRNHRARHKHTLRASSSRQWQQPVNLTRTHASTARQRRPQVCVCVCVATHTQAQGAAGGASKVGVVDSAQNSCSTPGRKGHGVTCGQEPTALHAPAVRGLARQAAARTASRAHCAARHSAGAAQRATARPAHARKQPASRATHPRRRAQTQHGTRKGAGKRRGACDAPRDCNARPTATSLVQLDTPQCWRRAPCFATRGACALAPVASRPQAAAAAALTRTLQEAAPKEQACWCSRAPRCPRGSRQGSTHARAHRWGGRGGGQHQACRKDTGEQSSRHTRAHARRTQTLQDRHIARTPVRPTSTHPASREHHHPHTRPKTCRLRRRRRQQQQQQRQPRRRAAGDPC
jgi:hypothetical protein